MEPSCYVQLHRHPLSHTRNSLLKNLGVVLNFHLIVPGNELNYLLNLSDSVYDFYLSLTDFLFESIVEQNCKFPTKHCLMNFLSLALVLSVSQAVYTFELFAHETVVSERFIMMKSLLAPSRTVVRRSRLPNVLAFPIAPMKISKTLFAVRLLIFNTKSFSIGYLTVSTENTLCLPFSDFPQHELGIVLPLILFGISDKIFMRKDWELLLTRAHIDSIKFRFVGKEVLHRKRNLFETWKCLRKGSFHQKDPIFFLLGVA